MHGKLAASLSMLLFGIGTFAGTSFALQNRGPTVGLPANLPAAARPTASLSDETRIGLSNTIGQPLADVTGVTSSSYDQARLLASTSLGGLYLVPGSRGMCLAIPDVASVCGQTTDDHPVLALLLRDGEGRPFVGGGVASSDVRRVAAATPDGERSLPLHGGVFTVDLSQALHAIEKVTFDD